MSPLRSLIVALASSGALALPTVSPAAEPPAEPVLRIEAEMHTASIVGIATDAANTYLATASDDKTVRIWDLASARLLRVLRPPIGAGNEGRLYTVAMSPDGSTVACGGWTGLEWGDATGAIYLFDRATGALIRRITGLGGTNVRHLAWSPDGRWLAAAAGHGIRLFRAADGALVGSDAGYGDRAQAVDFDRGDRLVSTALDGFVRLYTAGAGGVALLTKSATPGGKEPVGVRFSPDGARVAVGYLDSPRVDVLSARDLGLLYSPDRAGVQADLSRVAWSADGSRLYAGGRHGGSKTTLRIWTQGGQGGFTDVVVAEETLFALVSLRTGGVVFGTGDPVFGVVDASNAKSLRRSTGIQELRGNREALKVSRDGTTVEFAIRSGASRARFSLGDRRLVMNPPSDPGLTPALVAAPVDVRDWLSSDRPSLDGKPLKLRNRETPRALAVAPDRQSLLLGTGWSVYRFDRQGNVLWEFPPPDVTRGVNVSGDGRVAVVAIADGTIRWFRMSDGKELLSLFLHGDGRRWVLWSPSGYYDASPGAEDLLGWHVNRGPERAADFYPASRFRATFYRPDVVAKMLEALEESAALRLANDEAGRKTQAVSVAKTLPPVVDIVAPADRATVSGPAVRIRFSVRTAADAPVLAVRARVNGQAVTLPETRNIGVVGDEVAARELTVPVPPQDSEITLFAENRHGVSSPAVLRVKWRGAMGSPAPGEFTIKPKLYVLAIGVSQYQNTGLRLRFAAKDARDFAQAVTAQKGALYRDVETKLLTDAQATRDEVVDGLEWLQRQVTARDVGMLFLAGHGVTDPTGIYYYLPVNADTDRLKRTGVPFSDIKNTLGALAGKALFFVDTCHSGSIMGTRRAGPPDITAVVNELTSAENGVVVMASSTGKQYSLESAEWNNGAFTKALVEGLRGRADMGRTGKITHKMLDFYVSERVKELTDGRQTPVNPSPQGVPDFPIALVGGR